MLRQCEVCRASEKASRQPKAGASSALSFNKELQVDLHFLDCTVARQTMDTYPEHSSLVLVRPKNSLEVRGALCCPCIAVFGHQRCIQADEWGGRENELRTDSRTERQIRFQFQGKLACPGTKERACSGELQPLGGR